MRRREKKGNAKTLQMEKNGNIRGKYKKSWKGKKQKKIGKEKKSSTLEEKNMEPRKNFHKLESRKLKRKYNPKEEQT